MHAPANAADRDRPKRTRSGKGVARLVRVGARRLEEALVVLRHLRPDLTREDLALALRRGGPAHRLGYRLFGVEIEGRLVAVAGARPLVTLARGRHLHIDDLVVDPERRGQGLGRLLLEALETHARRRGLRALHLDSFSSAVPFYEALGFRDMDCRPMVKGLTAEASSRTCSSRVRGDERSA
jgi:GNAT superfamily N-acetyltransferase